MGLAFTMQPRAPTQPVRFSVNAMTHSPPPSASHVPLPPDGVAGLTPCGTGEQLPFDQILEGLGDGVWDWDLARGCERVSPRLKAMYGYGEADAFHQAVDLDALTHPDDLPAMLADRQAHWEGRTPVYLNEHRVRHKQGYWVWVLTRGIVISRDDQGRPRRMVGTHTDISQRKHAELDHQRTRERLELAMRGTDDGLWDWDLVHDRVHYSTRFQALLGYASNQEFEQRFSFRGQLHPDDMERVTAAVRAHISGASVAFDAEYRLRTRDGLYRWFHGRGRCGSWDAMGQPSRFAGHLTDITDRVEAMQARERWLAEQHGAQQREAVNALLGHLGQDLQRLLSALEHPLRQASQGLAPASPAAAGVGEALRVAQQAQQVVAGMRAFSARQAQHMRLVDVGAWLAEQVARLRPLAPEATVLQLHLPPQPLRVLADAGQLEQVLHSLCVHAWQGTGRAPGCVQVSAAATPDARGVALVVQDDGPGMAPEALAQALDPFPPHWIASEQVGLNSLAVAHRLVLAHQGRVAVHSEPGQGCRVEVWLPRVAVWGATNATNNANATTEAAHLANPTNAVHASAPLPPKLPQPPPPQPPQPPQPPPPTGKSAWHVVYIDDDETMVYLMGRMLHKRGVKVSTFERAADALAWVQDNPGVADLLVTDYNMQGMTGLDVVRELKQRAPDLPTAIASGHVTASMHREAQAEGVMAVLNKHDSVEALVTQLVDLLRQVPPKPSASA